MTVDPERRAAILDAVAAWLDAHSDEPLPAGIDPDLLDDPTPEPDLAAVVAAVVASRHEVKLQTKAVKRVEERLELTLAEFDRARADLARAGAPADALIELFDRLRRCADACSGASRDVPWISTRAAVERRVAGLAAGVAMIVERAGELLAGLGVRPFEPTGLRFDPLRMRAVGQGAATAAIPSGHVIETVRSGLERDGSVTRPADVVVARDTRDLADQQGDL